MSPGYDWFCEGCGAHGGADMRTDEGVWEGAQILLALHHAVSPTCHAGPKAIRVTKRASVLTTRKRPTRRSSRTKKVQR